MAACRGPPPRPPPAPAVSRLLRGRSGLAALLVVAVVTVAILVPVGASFVVLGQRALVFFDWLGPHLQPAELERLWRETLPAHLPWLQRGRAASRASSRPSSRTRSTRSRGHGHGDPPASGGRVHHRDLRPRSSSCSCLFFLLRDGARLRAALRPVSPFNDAQEALIFDHLGKTVKGALQSVVVVPLAQGIMAVPGFLIFGVPQPVTWGVAVSLAAIVPLLGSPLGWVPAVVWLFYTGAPTWQWVGMLVYGVVVISGIDNVVKPLLLRGTAQIHPLLGFLSILGGVLAFGAFGFLVGPVILSLVLSAMRIYRLDLLRGEVASPPAA